MHRLYLIVKIRLNTDKMYQSVSHRQLRKKNIMEIFHANVNNKRHFATVVIVYLLKTERISHNVLSRIL